MRIRSLRRRVIERDGYVCKICGEPLGTDEVTLDHIIPKSKGGTTSFANLRAACAPCNFARGNGDDPDPALRAKIVRKLGRLVYLPPRALRRSRVATIGAPTLTASFEEKLAAQKLDEERLAEETMKIMKGVG